MYFNPLCNLLELSTGLFAKPHTEVWQKVLQSPRMTEVGGSSGVQLAQVPQSKQGHLEQAIQDCIWMGFDCLQAQRLLHKLLGQAVLMFNHPHIKKSFS